MMKSLIFPFLITILALCGGREIAAQMPGKAAPAEELKMYEVRKTKGIRVCKQYYMEADQKGAALLQTKRLISIQHFDSIGHYQIDTLFGDFPKDNLIIVRYQYRGNFISGREYHYPGNKLIEARQHFDSEDIVRFATTSKNGLPTDTTWYFYDNVGELIRELRVPVGPNRKSDTTYFENDVGGNWARNETHYNNRIQILKYETDELGRAYKLTDSTRYYHDFGTVITSHKFRYGKNDFCYRIDHYNAEGKLWDIFINEYWDENGEVIEP
jgi:hypothetical protein